MDILFLGTSSGMPTKERNVTAIALTESQSSRWYLVDCGEATQHQLLHTNLSLATLNGIFITHIHGDHCYGLPGLLGSAAMSGRTRPLDIIAPDGIKEWLEATQKQTQLYLPFPLCFRSTEEFSGAVFGQFQVATVALSHRVPSFGYCFTEKEVEPRLNIEKLKALDIPPGPIWGQLKKGESVDFEGTTFNSSDFLLPEEPPRKVLICGDNDTPERLSGIVQGTQVLVHEATYTKTLAEKAGQVGHSYAGQVAAFAESAAVPNLLLTHFSPRYSSDPNRSPSITDIQDEAAQEYTGHLYLADDFGHYHLDKTGQLIQKKH